VARRMHRSAAAATISRDRMPTTEPAGNQIGGITSLHPRRRLVQGHWRIVMLLLSLAVALAGCGGGASKSKRAQPAPRPSPPAFEATLTAPTHTPRANAAWRYAIHVQDAQRRRLAATAEIQFLFAGQVVGRDTPPTHRFVGNWRDTIRWPRRSVGFPLVFRAVVTTHAGSRKLDYPVQVRP
jgi:hypothetical protein